jgi:hypothetical protein
MLGDRRWLMICAAALSLGGCRGTPDDRYLLPDRYTGWVQVTFNVPNAPAFPREEGFRLVTVPEDGRIETSEQPLYGEGYIHEYYWVLANNTRREAPVGAGFSVTGGPENLARWCFFIGSESDRARYTRLYGADTETARHLGNCAAKMGRLPADQD